MRLALALLLVTGCKEASDDLPISPGGGGGGTGGTRRPDAPVSTADAGMLTGRVCLLPDPRALTVCAASGAGGLMVSLGTSSAQTADDGSFSLMPPPTTAGQYWIVSGTNIETAAVAFGETTSLPAISSLVYADMLAATNAVVVTGQGALIARVTRADTPIENVTVIAQPQPSSAIYYDGPSVTEWELDSTGSFGVAWIPSITADTVDLTFVENAAQTPHNDVKVFADTITFVFKEIP